MNGSFILKETFEAEASLIYNAWLNSDLHSKMTGGKHFALIWLAIPFLLGMGTLL
jgi:hypothetical protein